MKRNRPIVVNCAYGGAFSASMSELPLELQPGATSMVESTYDPMAEEDIPGTLTVLAVTC